VKRCAIYARYSSDLQSPTSIEDQQRLCRAYAERQGWTVVSVFEDAALSGFGIEHRPGYQRLLATALSSPAAFEVILVEDLSRLTRDMAELLRVTARLRLKGVELVGVSDGIASNRQGAKMHLAVKALVNELYLDDLRDKTHRGLSGSVARGLSAGGRLYGYHTVPVPREAKPNDRSAPARFEVDEGEAAIVREIFRAYAHGRSMKAIAQDLNQRRIPFPAKDTKRGPTRLGWAVSTIRVILRNEKYAGVWVWNKTRFLKDPDSGRRRPVRRPPDEWIRQERPELRIVDSVLWSAVQRRLAFVAEAFGCRPGRPPRGPRGAGHPGRIRPISCRASCGVPSAAPAWSDRPSVARRGRTSTSPAGTAAASRRRRVRRSARMAGATIGNGWKRPCWRASGPR
jgi:DNA invertase Pin-like site-specific DNA recombinase